MEVTEPIKIAARGNSYLRCLVKATRSTRRLFCCDSRTPDDAKIHSVKSILYAAIERAGMETEKSQSVQAKLQNLLSLVAIRCDASPQEYRSALRTLEELEDQIYFMTYPRLRLSNLRSQIRNPQGTSSAGPLSRNPALLD
ncbi:MAG TPA: hypothetical protein PLL75_04660 [Candidatus Omnitrophota bacterium]|nr:hypothetical protein [Candidatus Omnitrophota bacterium]HPS37003.1 hypothetical protein [Candidatus Omnitrophota bacterium]